MNLTRRHTLVLGGGGLAALGIPRSLRAAAVEIIEMRGTARGEKVWFVPQGLVVAPGTTLRFVNRDPANSHTTTAYHPANYERQQRIPDGADPWDSDLLLPDESFEVTLTLPGVYDFYCIPHEHAGMVGRIVVGRPGDKGWQGPAAPSDDLPDEALKGFPDVEDILAAGRIIPEGAP